MDAETVIDFWFGSRAGPFDLGPHVPRWFGGGEAFDDEIRERFADLHRRAAAGEIDDWATDARGALALVLVLDQFSRNLCRGSAAAFACDDRAQRVMRKALDAGWDEDLDPAERVFLLMPAMHAESVDVQREGCRRFEALAAAAPDAHRAAYDNFASYAHRHRKVVERFGRFPHRNDRLERESTAEEEAYLADPSAERFG